MQQNTRQRNFVAAHSDFTKDSYQYDIIPLDINALNEDTRSPKFETLVPVPEEDTVLPEASFEAVPEDIIKISDFAHGRDIKDEKMSQPSIVQDLLNDHEAQGHIMEKKESPKKILGSQPVYKTVPWKQVLYIRSPTLRLHEEIKLFCSCLQPTEEEEKARNDALDRIQEVVKALWPDSRLALFGSFATGLYLPTSDIDAVILDSKCGDIRQGLKVLGKALSKKGIAIDIQTILKARVPIIKFEEKESGYQFDISFDAYNGPEAADNVRTLGKLIPAMSSLTMVLKVFLQQRDLNEVYSGGIGSYALLVMVANFLQTHWSRYSGNNGEIETNLGELLLDFFRLHGRALKPEVVGLSCSNGGKFFKKRSKSFHYSERPELPAVQDPNDVDNDLGKNSYNAGKVRMAFDYAYTRLLASIKPGESMLQRIIRLDPIIFSRYRGSDDPQVEVEKYLGKSKETLGTKRAKSQQRKQPQNLKKTKTKQVRKNGN